MQKFLAAGCLFLCCCMVAVHSENEISNVLQKLHMKVVLMEEVENHCVVCLSCNTCPVECCSHRFLKEEMGSKCESGTKKRLCGRKARNQGVEQQY